MTFDGQTCGGDAYIWTIVGYSLFKHEHEYLVCKIESIIIIN